MQTPAVGNYRIYEEKEYARGAGDSAYPGLWKGLIFACPSQVVNPTTAKDLSRNHINGAGTDLTVSPEKAFVFNGSTSHIILGTDASFDLGSYAFACRFKTTSASQFQRLLYKGNSSSIEPVAIYLYQGKPRIEYYNNGPNYYAGIAGALNGGQWHTVCLVRHAGVNMYVYVDGGFYADTTSGSADGGQTVTSATNLRIGSRNNGDGDFTGSMKDIFLWNRYLTPREAQQVSMGRFPTSAVKRRVVAKAGAVVPPTTSSKKYVYFNPMFGPKVFA